MRKITYKLSRGCIIEYNTGSINCGSVRAYTSARKALNARSEDNIKKILRISGAKSAVTAEQVHSSRIAVVTGRDAGSEISGADGVAAFEGGFALAVFTADCLPVIITGGSSSFNAVLHCGWRSLQKGIISGTLKKILNSGCVDPKTLSVIFGPSARKCCYEVSSSFWRKFPAEQKRKTFSMEEYASKELEVLGIKKEKIFSPGLCTVCGNDLFFSYRKEKTDSRIVTYIISGKR